MTNTVSNVIAGKPKVTGGVLLAPIGTALPTDAAAAPDAAFDAAGYVGDAGLTETVDATTSRIKAWGGDVVKILQTEHAVSYAWIYIEALNPIVLKDVHGDANVAVTAATVSTGTLVATKITSDEAVHKTYLFEIRDGNAKVRVVVPDGQARRNGDTVYSDEAVVAYPMICEAFADDAGVKAYKYSDDGVFAAA